MDRHKAARQYSDQMHCTHCKRTWDINDPDPPPCEPSEPPKSKRRWTREDWKVPKTNNPITPEMWDKLKRIARGEKDTDGQR